jgi:hypothetical protein
VKTHQPALLRFAILPELTEARSQARSLSASADSLIVPVEATTRYAIAEAFKDPHGASAQGQIH